MQGLRRIAVHLALGALMLRAILPAGWMPNPAGADSGAPFVICTMDGPAIAPALQSNKTDDKNPQQAPSDPRAHEVCPFAAAAQLAPPAPAALFALPVRAAVAAPRHALRFAGPRPVLYTPQAPRAPPVPI